MTTLAERWRGRSYAAFWMTAYVGRTVHIRPHAPDAIEVVDPTTRQCLGIAHLHDLSGLRLPRVHRDS